MSDSACAEYGLMNRSWLGLASIRRGLGPIAVGGFDNVEDGQGSGYTTSSLVRAAIGLMLFKRGTFASVLMVVALKCLSVRVASCHVVVLAVASLLLADDSPVYYFFSYIFLLRIKRSSYVKLNEYTECSATFIRRCLLSLGWRCKRA